MRAAAFVRRARGFAGGKNACPPDFRGDFGAEVVATSQPDFRRFGAEVKSNHLKNLLDFKTMKREAFFCYQLRINRQLFV